jgi:Uma2 family endonuclease
MYNGAMAVYAIPKLTYEEFRQLPDDGKRYELIQGKVHLSPAPSIRHQCVLGNLHQTLGPFVVRNRLGEVFVAPVDVRLSEDTALQPDLIFVSKERVEIVEENFIDGPPDLVVEILSPSTAAHDRATKLNLYAVAGVPWLWLIDPLARTVEVLKLEGTKYLVDSILAGKQTLTSPLFPGWGITLDELFRFPSHL